MTLNISIKDKHFIQTPFKITDNKTTIGNFKQIIYKKLKDLEPSLMELKIKEKILSDEMTFENLVNNKIINNDDIIDCELKRNKVKIINENENDSFEIIIEPTDTIYGIKYKIFQKKNYDVNSFDFDLYIQKDEEKLEEFNFSVFELNIFNVKKFYIKKKDFINNREIISYNENFFYFIVVYNLKKSILIKLNSKSTVKELKDKIFQYYKISNKLNNQIKLYDINENELDMNKNIQYYNYDLNNPIYICAKLMVNIIIQYGNEKFNLSFYSFDDIKTLKENIYNKLGIPIIEQILKLNNLNLENNRSFFYYCQMNDNNNEYKLYLLRKKFFLLLHNEQKFLYEIEINKKVDDLKKKIIKDLNMQKNFNILFDNLILKESDSIFFYENLLNLDIIILTIKILE